MKTLSSKRIRMQVDAGDYNNFVDALSGQTPQIAKGCDVSMELGLFLNLVGGAVSDDLVVDFSASAIQSLTLNVRTAPSSSTNLMAKTVTAFDNTLTAATWTDLSKAHAIFAFTDTEANIAAGTYHLGLLAITVGGAEIALGQTVLTVTDFGVNTGADDPAVNPGDAISLEQADARYTLLGGALPATAFQQSVPSGHTVTIPSGYAVIALNGFTVAAGGTLNIDTGGILFLLPNDL
jgi:hypothetical protein